LPERPGVSLTILAIADEAKAPGGIGYRASDASAFAPKGKVHRLKLGQMEKSITRKIAASPSWIAEA